MPNKWFQKEELPSDEELLEMFQHYDTDKNGSMNLSELHSLLKDADAEMTPFEAKCLFNIIDADGNGKVTFSEFKTMMKKINDEDVADDLFIKAFSNAADIDGNGFVSKAELEKVFEEKFEEGMFEIITAMMDKDGDGRISIDELVSAMKGDGILS